MQSSYPVNPFHEAVNRTINRALTHFSKRLSMTRHPARPESEPMSPVAAAPGAVAIEDWDAMFTAVKARLTLAAQSSNATTPQPAAADSAQVERLCATVLECVAALDQLQFKALDELARRDRRG